MGQLEKYGLYVMCLVIFLILGVTLWGEPANAKKAKVRAEAAIISGAVDGPVKPVEASFRRPSKRIEDLLKPESRPKAAPRSSDRPKVKPRVASPKLLESKPASATSPLGKVNALVKEVAASAAKPKASPAPKRRRYKVKPGDDLSTIAQRELGSIKYERVILAANPNIKNRNRIKVGDSIILPAISGGKAASATSANKVVASGAYRTYKVRKGDAYEKIAEREFGDAARHKELQRMNPGIPPNRLIIGKSIKIPLK